MERQAAHLSLIVPHPLLKDAGASRRSIAASWQRRAALSDAPFRLASGHASGGPLRGPRVARLGQASRPAVSQLLAGDRNVPGRSPGAARELGGCVHPPPAGAAHRCRACPISAQL